MKLISTTHNHTVFCDGKNTPAEMAEAALALGFTDFGFSGHSLTTYAPYYGVQDEQAYLAALRAVRTAYEGRLRIAIGMEQDFNGPVKNRAALDYIIGSVHDIQGEVPDTYYWMDGPPEMFAACRDNRFGGDVYALTRHFYALTVQNAQQYKPDIIGHFDLVAKNNENNAFFDEANPAYRSAALEAVHACLETGAVFEVNTGGVQRGYRSVPYPARFILEELCRCGARVTLNADAHTTQAIAFHLNEAAALLRAVGFRTVAMWKNGGFVEKPLDDGAMCM